MHNPTLDDHVYTPVCAPSNPSILIVDDSPVNRQLLAALLKPHYSNLQLATNGEQCLEAISTQNFDLVMLDLNMPLKSGFEVLGKVSTLPLERRPVFIVVSANNEPTTISRALQMGAADYVSTPFNRDELLARVGMHMALRSREQDLEARVQQRTAELKATNQKLQKAHSQLILAEKMASLGQLSAGIAHEINNPIGYIHSNLDSLKDYVDDLMSLLSQYQQLDAYITDPQALAQLQRLQNNINLSFLESDVQQLINDSLKGARQVRQIINDLRAFSHHPQNKQWEMLDLNDCINSALNIVKAELRYKVDLHLALQDDLPPVECLPTQIYQVMTNLLVNAAQAIPERGEIFITTRRRAQHAEVIIRDTGAGIDSEVMHKIFDPFFTTKGVNQGTGLGLYVSYSIVEGHHGSIEVDSQPGQGCTFMVRLPFQQF